MTRLLPFIKPLTWLLLLLNGSVNAHQFAPQGGHQIPFWAHSEGAVGEIDLSTYDIGGIGTYASVPYENCFVESTSSEGFDIAILGAPFDTVSHHLLETNEIQTD